MAPELWNGAPNVPATDLYAATAVLCESLTGKPPFSGRPGQLRDHHESTPVPLDRVDPPLQDLIAWGMAKNPADRPRSARSFVSELERAGGRRIRAVLGGRGPPRARGARRRAAAAACRRGGRRLREGDPARPAQDADLRVGRGRRAGRAGRGGRGRAVQAVRQRPAEQRVRRRLRRSGHGDAAGGGVQVRHRDHVHLQRHGHRRPSRGRCTYQWLYSSGKPGPVQTLNFAAAGHQHGDRRDRQGQQGGQRVGRAQAAHARPPRPPTRPRTSCCAAPPTATSPCRRRCSRPRRPSPRARARAPSLTASGTITSKKAGTVSYYWALGNGQNSAAGTVTFSTPGTKAVTPLTFTPPALPANGTAVLVVTAPSAAASSPAAYSVSCTVPVTADADGQLVRASHRARVGHELRRSRRPSPGAVNRGGDDGAPHNDRPDDCAADQNPPDDSAADDHRPHHGTADDAPAPPRLRRRPPSDDCAADDAPPTTAPPTTHRRRRRRPRPRPDGYRDRDVDDRRPAPAGCHNHPAVDRDVSRLLAVIAAGAGGAAVTVRAAHAASGDAAAQVGAVGVQLGQEVADRELDRGAAGVQVQPVDAQQRVAGRAAERRGRPGVGERDGDALLRFRDGRVQPGVEQPDDGDVAGGALGASAPRPRPGPGPRRAGRDTTVRQNGAPWCERRNASV